MGKDLKVSILMDIYGNLLTEKQFEIMDYYYNSDFSLAEISEHLNITRQGVRDSVKHAELALNSLEEKLGLYEKLLEENEKQEKIIEAIQKIIELNTNQLHNNLLHNWVCDIYELIVGENE